MPFSINRFPAVKGHEVARGSGATLSSHSELDKSRFNESKVFESTPNIPPSALHFHKTPNLPPAASLYETSPLFTPSPRKTGAIHVDCRPIKLAGEIDISSQSFDTSLNPS